MSQLWRDIRFALRLLSRSPVFAITTSLLLGIGIGANTLIFSIVDKLLLRPLPVKDPARLVRLIEVHPNEFVTWEVPFALYEQLHAHQNRLSLQDPLFQSDLDVLLELDGTAERIRANAVSRDFFSTLGIPAQLGRVLSAEDDISGALTAVISHDFWQRRFAGSKSIVGASLRLTGRKFTVVGVLPEGVNGLTVDTTPDVRIPIAAARLLLQKAAKESGEPAFLQGQIFARLRPGATLARAQAEAEPLLRTAYEEDLLRTAPELARTPRNQLFDSRLRFESAELGVSSLRAQFSRGLGILMGCVGLLLLMACANVAGLLLARSAGRAQEVTLRFVLGANPWRVVWQLLTESLVLGSLGGILGIAITYLAMPLLLAALPPVRDRAAVLLPLSVHVNVDPRVLGFAVLASLVTAVLFGLSPALHGARQDLSGPVRGTRAATARLSVRNILVVGQVAVCLLLLIGAGLLVETLHHMQTLNAGFDRDHVVTFTIDPSLQGYTPDRTNTLTQQLLDRTRTLPGVAAVAISTRGLMRGTGLKTTMSVAGRTVSKGDFMNCSLNGVTPGYFDAMGIRLIAGRDFSVFNDATQKPAKAIVNQALVRRLFPDGNALGKLIGNPGPDGVAQTAYEVIGISSDAKYRSLREPVPPTVYSHISGNLNFGFILNVRARSTPEPLINAVRETIRSLDPQLPIIEARTLREEVDLSLWQERLLARLATLFGGFAALLAALGLYGALDFAVKARTREIGVRVALGASPGRVVGMLSRETVLLLGSGVLLGLVAYAVAIRWLRQVLYDIARTDAWVIGAALLFIAFIALLAAAPPIWRAVRIDASTALRHE